MSVRASDLLGAAGVFAIGAYAVFEALGYPGAPAGRMGPASFPTLLGSIAMVIATLIVLSAAKEDHPSPVVAWRPFLFVMSGIGVFCAAVAFLGLVPAALCSVFVAAFADRNTRLVSALAVAAFTAVSSWLVFIVLLGVQIPAFRLPG